jgi:CheY-like chemotaxis protein
MKGEGVIKNILLAEDDRGTALVVKRQLESKGYNVFTAGNGIEALNVLSSSSVDLIITDVVMPQMDGVDLYEHVKNDPNTASIPIIIVTDKQIYQECFSALGVTNFISKPTIFGELLEKIKYIGDGLSQVKRYPKILISGYRSEAMEKMKEVLKQRKCLVISATTTSDILIKSLFMEPGIVFIDILFRDNVPANEIIKALRCFGHLSGLKIITYAYFFPEELGTDVNILGSMEDMIGLCKQAGADDYIGRLNKSILTERLTALEI